MPVKDYYNKLYKNENNVFGGKPIPLISKLLEYKSTGSVYEIGAGEGRNGLYLASKGFDVEMNDISDIGVKKINEKAKELE